MMRRIIWHAVTEWMLWRARRRLRKAVPALAALDTARSELARRHAAGAEARTHQKKAYGLTKPKRPMPGSRGSRWKRRMDGTIVERT